MPIHYALYENRLTDETDDYLAVVRPSTSYDLDDVIDRMLQGGTTITRADAYSVLSHFFTTVQTMVLDGANVNTPIANFSVSIKGRFDGPSDRFESGRHTLNAVANPGRALKKAVATQGRPVKRESVRPIPSPVEYVDHNSDTRNDVLTPGGMGTIFGSRLRFDNDDPEQGIFFVAADNSETRVELVASNTPKQLVFQVPADVEAGVYALEVRAASPNGSTVWSGRLDEQVRVL